MMYAIQPDMLVKLANRISDQVMEFTDLKYFRQGKVIAITANAALVELTSIEKPIREKADGYIDSIADFDARRPVREVGHNVTIYLKHLQPWESNDRLVDPWDEEGLFGWLIAKKYLERKLREVEIDKKIILFTNL